MYNKMFWYNVEMLENVHKSFPVMIESESKCFLEKRFSVFYNLVTALSFVSQFLLLVDSSKGLCVVYQKGT